MLFPVYFFFKSQFKPNKMLITIIGPEIIK